MVKNNFRGVDGFVGWLLMDRWGFLYFNCDIILIDYFFL